jgi:hypothetical protein
MPIYCHVRVSILSTYNRVLQRGTYGREVHAILQVDHNLLDALLQICPSVSSVSSGIAKDSQLRGTNVATISSLLGGMIICWRAAAIASLGYQRYENVRVVVRSMRSSVACRVVLPRLDGWPLQQARQVLGWVPGRTSKRQYFAQSVSAAE